MLKEFSRWLFVTTATMFGFTSSHYDVDRYPCRLLKLIKEFLVVLLFSFTRVIALRAPC
jgi:hypothetical protein